MMSNFDERESYGNEGMLETIIFLVSVGLTYSAGATDGIFSLILTVLALVGWFWLMGLAAPGEDDDNGLP